MLHQTKQAQFRIKTILNHSCNVLVVLIAFMAQQRGYASIRGRVTRAGQLQGKGQQFLNASRYVYRGFEALCGEKNFRPH